MSHHWLLITFWFSPVSLQYISTGEAEPALENPHSSVHFSIPYVNYLSPLPNPEMNIQSQTFNDDFNQFYARPESDVQRRRRDANFEKSNWYEVINEAHKSPFGGSIEEKNQKPFLATYSLINDVGFVNDDNETNLIVDLPEKKNFSPWGGKRNARNTENSWSWKRSSVFREPSMPKRVRFSPWGGKRSGQMIFKPNSKSTRTIYASVLPELTGIVSNFMPLGRTLNWAGLQLIPTHILDKRNPSKMLAMSSPLEGKLLRDALPFKAFMEQIPRSYKPGHPYNDVNLKKDGKRKVKFSAWGGKRFPPIIGPIWTPTSTDVKESTLNSILLIQSQNPKETQKAQ